MSSLALVPDILVHHARSKPQRVAYSGPGWTLTYGDLEKRTRHIATHLAQEGIGPGHFVAVVLPRCQEAVESLLAVTRAGAVAVPLDPRSPSSELAHDRHLPVVRIAAGERSIIIVTTHAGQVDAPGSQKQGRAIPYQDWIQAAKNEGSNLNSKLDSFGEDEPAFLHYTSGTTSSPKGVLTSQRGYLLNVSSLISAFQLTSEDRFFFPAPVFHCLGHSLCIIATVVTGASAYLPDADTTTFESLKDPEAREITLIVGAPTTFHDLLDSMQVSHAAKLLSLPRLRACMFAGSSAPPSLSAQIDGLFGVPLLNNYGCTEACGAIAVSKHGHRYLDPSSMTLLPHWDIKLVDQDGNQVKDGEQGELLIRGPGLMLGYYKHDSPALTEDGWYATGDKAISSGSEISLVGRSKEIIIRGGENILPQELEQVILQQPDVADVVVAGIPHRLLGETPGAFIVKRAPDIDLDLSALLIMCRKALPDYKVPTAFYEIDAVPRTLIGKPKRLTMSSHTSKPLTIQSKLLSKAAVESLVIAETVGACGLDVGVEEGKECRGMDWLRYHSDQPFSFLGLSSMAGVVLRDRLASLTGVPSLPNTLVFDHPTPAALSSYLYDRLLKLRAPSPHSASVDMGANSVEVEPIAIISMACRYPGGISSPDDLWQLVLDEVDATTDFPDDRGWDIEALYNPSPDVPNTSTTKRGGFLPDFAHFDAGLFGMAPREALATDPQQRLLLETTWELAERGGIAPLSLRGSQTGVFVGTLYDDYEENGFGNNELEAHLGLGSSSSVISGRVSYCFGLHGPSLAVSTGCSSSMVAIHLAAQALRNNECTLAIAGGVTTMATPRPFTMFSKRRGLSSDGRCRAYSGDASGTGWAEGVGLILLERLSDAKRNRHKIHGLICGSAVNSDGKSNGLTAPSGPAQQMCIQSALNQARLSPENVDVLEGHGTATPLGDPIEVQAVISSYGNGYQQDKGNSARRPNPLLLGSIKSNIGHIQAAAAVAGIIQMVQAMRHGIAPTSLHIREPTPQIDWEDSGVELLSKAREWPSVDRPRRSAVSSFGIGGTNSHIILEQSEPEQTEASGSCKVSAGFPWLISGASEEALRAQAHSLLMALGPSKNGKAAGTLRGQNPTDIAFSLATARSPLKYRATVTYSPGESAISQIQAALRSLSQGQPHPDVVTAQTSTTGNSPRLACLFSGQGSRIPTADAIDELCQVFSVFSGAFNAARGEVDQHLECSISHAMRERSDLAERTDFSQAILFVFEVAMFRLLESFGIRPDVVTGHSLGEIVAAHVSGVLSLRVAASIVTARGKLMVNLPPNGGMVSISATEEEVTEQLKRSGAAATIAVINSQKSVVVSGTQDAVKGVADNFTALGRRATVLRNIRHGFHSPMMDGMLSDLESQLVSLMRKEQQRIGTTLISTVTGKRADVAQLGSPGHWVRHVREPVRFADAVRELQSSEQVSIFVEVGPSAILSPHLPGALATSSTVNKLLNMLGQLWSRGVPIDWLAVFVESGARLVDLPVYAFERQRYWLPFISLLPGDSSKETSIGQPKERGMCVYGSAMGHDILFSASSIPGTSNILCAGMLSPKRQPWLRDHMIGDQLLFPATGFVELALRASRECVEYSEYQDMVLDQMIVLAPLALYSGEEDEAETEGQESHVQVLIREPQIGNKNHHLETSRKVDVYSRPSGVATHHSWTHHATGTLKFTSSPSTTPDPVIEGSHLTNKESEVEISKAYDILDDVGIKYGPLFRGVSAIWQLEDNGILAEIEPAETQTSSFVLHPAVLDAALHAPVLASPDKIANGDIRLPFCLGGIQVLGAAGTVSGPILARINYLDEERFSVILSEKSTGKIIAMVSEAQLRPWKPPVPGLSFPGEIKPSSGTDKIVRIPTNSRDVDSGDLSQTVHAALAEALGAVHDWGAARSPGSDDSRVVFVTEKATWIGNTDSGSEIDLAAATVWGFVRSAQAEFGGDRVVLVDLDGSTDSEDSLLQALASSEEVMSLRRGKMMIPKLQKQPQVTESSRLISLDINRTILITGGTGGLGAILSRDLVHNKGVKNMLLVSRSGIEAAGAREFYDELKSAGAVVRVGTYDASDRSQLAALFQGHEQSGLPPITAVIHCAGVVDDAVLGSQTPERMSRVLRPKVDAAWNLHQLMPDTVRSFVLFSSYVSVVGNEGQAAYTGANAFLDALARFRLSRGLPALSLAWGPWKNDGGMAAQNKLLQVEVPPRIRNAEAFTDQQGLALLYKALEMEITKPPEAVLVPLLLRGPFPLVPSPVNKGRGARSKKGTNKNGSGSGALWRKNLAAVPLEERHSTLLALVKNEIAAVLGYQGQELPDKPFVDLGFDSFTSVMLTNRLRVLTGFASLPVTLALDYDTPQALVQHLLPRIEAEPEPQEANFEDVDDASATSKHTDSAASDSGRSSSSSSSSKEKNSGVSSSAVSTTALEDQDELNPEVFRGLATIHRRLAVMEQYTAAATLLASAALAMPTFPKSGTSLASCAAEPHRLAAAGPSSSSSTSPVIFIAPFFPRIKIEGIGLSMYSNVASAMAGERDVFELPHPEVQAVPEDLDTLAELHLSTIRHQFSDRKEIILAGYSAGGAVAYAVASKLARSTENQQQRPKLAGFVLVDTYLTMTGHGDPDWLNALPAEALVSRLQGGGDNKTSSESLVGDLDLALAKVGGYFGTLRDWDESLHPLPDSLPTLFVRASDPSEKMPRDPDVWRPRWARADRTVDVPGSHLALLDKRYAPAIAVEILRWAKEEVELQTKQAV